MTSSGHSVLAFSKTPIIPVLLFATVSSEGNTIIVLLSRKSLVRTTSCPLHLNNSKKITITTIKVMNYSDIQ